MADRYWVGGTANWDSTVGTKWATASGGTGGASAPTTADDVFFDNLSTGTVTIGGLGNAAAKSVNYTGFAGTITGTGAITVAGGITLNSTMGYTHTGTTTISGTGTLTTAGKAFSAVTVNGAGITVTLGDALNTGGRALNVTQGTFDTANYSVTLGTGDFNSGGTLTRAIQLGSSTVTLGGSAPLNISGSGLTFDAGTSQINHTATTPTLSANLSLTFYNYSFTSTSVDTRTISAAQTFNNLTLVASASGLSQLSLGGNQTVNGTLTCAGSSFSSRAYVRSSVAGTVRTITAAAISADNCDFEDITLAGAASPASPSNAGDCGGNSNITFPSAKTVYRVGTNTTWAGSSSWAPSSGGTGSDANFPLPQDTVIVDNATTGSTLSIETYNRGALDMSSRTSAYSLTASSAANFYGSFILGSGVTISGSNGQTYRGRTTSTLDTAGKTPGFTFLVDSAGGGLQLGSALNSTSTLNLTRGTFDAAGYNVTISGFTSSNSNTRILSMGSGLWTLTGTGTVWSTAIATALTLNKGTADILLSNTSASARTINGAGVALNKLTIGGATGTSTLSLNNVNVAELASAKTVAHTIAITVSPLTVGTWSVTGTAGNVVTLNSSTAGTQRTLNLTNASSGIDYLAVQDIAVSTANTFYVGANSTNNGNNTNVIFTANPGSGNVTVSVTGTAATGEVGTVTVDTGSVNVDVAVSGVSATGAVGTVTVDVTANIDVPVAGVSATGDVGDVTVTTTSDITVSVTGVAATGAVGTAVAVGSADVPLAGLQATGAVGDVTTTADANTAVTGLSAAGQVGSVQAIPSIEVPVTGLSAAGAVGSVSITISMTVVPVGVFATGFVTPVIVWGPIIPSPGSTWTEVDPNAINPWTPVEPAPPTTWTTVAA